MATKAVLFDVGGTLFSYSASPAARAERAEQLASWLGVTDLEAAKKAIFDGFRKAGVEYTPQDYYLHADMFRAGGRYAAEILGGTLDAEQEQWFADAVIRGMTNIVPRPGVPETLAKLNELGLHVGAVSNADEDHLEAMIDALGVREYFHSLLCSETAQSCKPHRGIFDEALMRAGCEAHEAVFVGDTPDADIVGAETVGMRAVLIIEETQISIPRGEARPGTVTIREFGEILRLV